MDSLSILNGEKRVIVYNYSQFGAYFPFTQKALECMGAQIIDVKELTPDLLASSEISMDYSSAFSSDDSPIISPRSRTNSISGSTDKLLSKKAKNLVVSKPVITREHIANQRSGSLSEKKTIVVSRKDSVSLTQDQIPQTWSEAFKLELLVNSELPKKTPHERDIFQVMNLSSIQLDVSEKPKAPDHIFKTPQTRVLLNVKSVDNVSNEVLFFTLSLHDVESRIKLTEDFTFHFFDVEDNNIPEIIKQLLEAEKSPCIRRALFPLAYYNPNIYILVRVRSLLRAEYEDIISPYVSHKNKDKQKMIDQYLASSKVTVRAKQPFAWGWSKVFNDDVQMMVEGEREIRLFTMKPVINDAIFYDTVNNPEAIKKLKPIEAKLNVEALIFTPERYHVTNVLDTSMIKYPNYDIVSGASGMKKNVVQNIITDPIKEVKEFEQHFHQPYPYSQYENNLYLYPLKINLSTSKVKVRTLAIRVWLLEDEGSPEKYSIDSIYSSCSKTLLKDQYITCEYGEKQPVMFEEIKLKLPVKLTAKHHLFFQILSINTKLIHSKSKSDPTPERVVGQCFLGLFNNQKFIKDGEYTLAILPPSDSVYAEKLYLNDPPTNFIDEDKFSFTFQTRLSSSIYTTDDHLAKYFECISSSNTNVAKALESLRNVPERIILHFFPVILYQLFRLLCDPTYASDRSIIFSMTIDVASKVFNQTMVTGKMSTSQELMHFAKYHFDNYVGLDLAYEIICSEWNNLLSKIVKKNEASDDLGVSSVIELGWWFLDLMLKSMVMKIKDDSSDATSRMLRYSDSFKGNLISIIMKIHEYRSKSVSGFEFVNTSFANFLAQCFYIMDRGFVFSLVNTYMNEFSSDKTSLPFKFKFLFSICENENYVALNMPITHPISDLDNDILKYWEHHFLAGYLINELKSALLAGEEVKLTRAKAIVRFRDLLWKHFMDERYQNEQVRRRIASLYFPFFIYCTENAKALTKIASNENDIEFKEWITCLIWIIRHCDPAQISAWRNLASKTNICRALTLLRKAIIEFSKLENAAFYEEVALTVIDFLEVFTVNIEKKLLGEKGGIGEQLLAVIVAIIKQSKIPTPIENILLLCKPFIQGYKTPLFKFLSTNTLCGELCIEIYKLVSSPWNSIKWNATSIIYLLIETNVAEMNQCIRMKLHTTMALSKILKSSPNSISDLKNAIVSMKKHSESSNSSEIIQKEIMALLENHERIIRDTSYLSTLSTENIDVMIDLYYQISLEYNECPELRVQWLLDIAKHLEKASYFEESAQARVQISSLIAEYLLRHNVSGLPKCEDFIKVSPWLKNALKLSLCLYEDNTIHSHLFSEDAFITNMYDAYQMFLKSYNYESALQVLIWLCQYCTENKKYQNVAQYGNSIASASDLAHKANSSQSRFLPNFYRVGFYGNGFGSDNRVEYVYMASGTSRMGEFTESLISRYSVTIGAIEMLNNKPISEQKLDPTKNYIQVVNCSIYFEWKDIIGKDLKWREKFMNSTKFSFISAYSKDGGKVSEEVDKAYKQRDILTVGDPLPNIKFRTPVISKQINLLEPIESAIDLIIDTSSKLKEALNCVPLDPKKLQIILQGSILTQVNAGPMAIVKTFLADESQYPIDKMRLLKEQLKMFMRLCQFGLRLNAKLIEQQTDLKELHFAISTAFQSLSDEVSKYIDLKKEI